MSRNINIKTNKMHKRVVNRYHRSVNRLKRESGRDIIPLDEIIDKNGFFMIEESIDDLLMRIENNIFSSIRSYLRGRAYNIYDITLSFYDSVCHNKVKNDFSSKFIPILVNGINKYIEAQGDSFYVSISGIDTIPSTETENSKLIFTVEIKEIEEVKVC